MTIHDDTAASVPEMDCVDFVRLVDDLVDSDPRQWGAVVARHLRDCPPCLVYLHQMLDLKILLNRVFDNERLGDDQIARVIGAIEALPDD